ncbi:hypothetical protein BAE44_0015189 [Dichanthelium oligosanthes]|uniref:Pentatricopeptide repeat-containing protein n=1 Tax=Dichanthelium oligosanthes TaxID=888268 RepID=A0A1E5VF95_9POAL|nr:hypothetical protein BAE44_0015189 [Dichanthelium oligosanthes]
MLVRHRLPALLCLLPRDHLTLLLLSSAKHRHAHARSLLTTFMLHALAVASGHLPSDLRLAHFLLSLYLSLSSPASTRRLVVDTPHPDTVTWNTLLHACLRMGLLPAAHQLFNEMPDGTLSLSIPCCPGTWLRGTWSAPGSSSMKCRRGTWLRGTRCLLVILGMGDMESTKKMFDEMPLRDVVSWNSMLDGYA